jgi:cell division protein ZapA
MAQVSVTIDGKKYRLACNEGEESRLERIAGLVDGKIDELRRSFGEIGDQRLTVMAALTFADQYVEARDAAEAERDRARADAERSQAIAATLDGLGTRIEQLAARLAGGTEA